MEMKHFSRIPFGQLAIIAMDNCRELGEKINKHVVARRNRERSEHEQDIYLDEIKEDYRVSVDNVRFANGEGKAVLRQTVREKISI